MKTKDDVLKDITEIIKKSWGYTLDYELEPASRAMRTGNTYGEDDRVTLYISANDTLYVFVKCVAKGSAMCELKDLSDDRMSDLIDVLHHNYKLSYGSKDTYLAGDSADNNSGMSVYRISVDLTENEYGFLIGCVEKSEGNPIVDKDKLLEKLRNTEPMDGSL